ncbi:unnamed protein product, partial [Laminaria digitata]
GSTAVADTLSDDCAPRYGQIWVSQRSGRLLSQSQDACLPESVTFNNPLLLFSNGRLLVPGGGIYTGGICVAALGTEAGRGCASLIGGNHQHSRFAIERRARSFDR